MAEGQSKVLNVVIPDTLRAGAHANIVRVTTTGDQEVILDFVFSHPQDIRSTGERQGTLVARITLSVNVARQLLMILSSHFGKVKKE